MPVKHKLVFLHCPVDLEQNKTLKKIERMLGHTLKARERWQLLKEHDGRRQAGRWDSCRKIENRKGHKLSRMSNGCQD